MDLNSYLTDFFSMINNQNFSGGQSLIGGKKPDGVTFGDGLTNEAILKYYFQEGTVTGATVDNNKLVFKDDARKREFIEHQVEIVKYMLEAQGQRGGMYGGNPLDAQQASAAAAQQASAAAAVLLLGDAPAPAPGVHGNDNILTKFLAKELYSLDDFSTIYPNKDVNTTVIVDYLNSLPENKRFVERTKIRVAFTAPIVKSEDLVARKAAIQLKVSIMANTKSITN